MSSVTSYGICSISGPVTISFNTAVSASLLSAPIIQGGADSNLFKKSLHFPCFFFFAVYHQLNQHTIGYHIAVKVFLLKTRKQHQSIVDRMCDRTVTSSSRTRSDTRPVLTICGKNRLLQRLRLVFPAFLQRTFCILPKRQITHIADFTSKCRTVRQPVASRRKNGTQKYFPSVSPIPARR